MSQILINEYLRRIEEIRRLSGSTTEKIISDAFQDLLKAWAQ